MKCEVYAVVLLAAPERVINKARHPEFDTLVSKASTILCAQMSITFTQLLALPDDLVQEGVLSALSWKELARLDEALHNKRLRSQLHSLLPTLTMDCALSSATPASFLLWVNCRGMHIHFLSVDGAADNNVVQAFIESGVQAEHVQQLPSQTITQ